MVVAVIGTGFIGGTVGRAFAEAGIPTVFGSRHPGAEEAVTTVEEAVRRADTVLLALPAAAVEEFLTVHGGALDGKLVIDAANNFAGPVMHHAEAVAAHAPGARYARAFNTLGGENLADPVFDGVPADLFFSAPPGDREAVETLISAVGLRPMYLGEGQQDTVDGVLRLWVALAVGQRHGRRLAFRTLIRSA